MARFVQIGEPVTPRPARSAGRFALLNLGFRPFYLFAGTFATIAIAIWVARFSGWLGGGDYLGNSLWHAHEMIFGYTFAVIVGFLFTAVRAWTNEPTPSGGPLALIAALWIAARVLLAMSLPLASAFADTVFVLAAVWGIAVPLYASGNRRNLFLIVVLLAIGLANLAFHLGMAGIIDLPMQRMLQLALDLIMVVMAVMGGRVIPMFTANALQRPMPAHPAWLEHIALGSLAALLAADLVAAPPAFAATLAALAALAHGARLALWQPWLTLRRPILWILHVSYAWIVAHLVLRAAVIFDPAAASLATHALTVGGIGGLTLGMMTRTARGHTGRTLTAEGVETTAYLLVQLAAAVRVLLPLIDPSLTVAAVEWSGAFWVAAFALFVWKYAPILWQPRVDGKPG